MYDTTVTVVGNLVDTPTLRRTGNGVEVANFRVASTSRRYDRASDSWVDRGSLFLGVTCWRRLATNVAGSMSRGDPVVLTGRLHARTYEVNGQQRTAYEVDAFAVGPDLARGTAVFQRSVVARADPAGGQPVDPQEWEGTSEAVAGAA
ncbi:MAG TPA: single-stranded DNA-binding protein [Mycobacteriales bacterium]